MRKVIIPPGLIKVNPYSSDLRTHSADYTPAHRKICSEYSEPCIIIHAVQDQVLRSCKMPMHSTTQIRCGFVLGTCWKNETQKNKTKQFACWFRWLHEIQSKDQRQFATETLSSLGLSLSSERLQMKGENSGEQCLWLYFLYARNEVKCFC